MRQLSTRKNVASVGLFCLPVGLAVHPTNTHRHFGGKIQPTAASAFFPVKLSFGSRVEYQCFARLPSAAEKGREVIVVWVYTGHILLWRSRVQQRLWTQTCGMYLATPVQRKSYFFLSSTPDSMRGLSRARALAGSPSRGAALLTAFGIFSIRSRTLLTRTHHPHTRAVASITTHTHGSGTHRPGPLRH